jgi:hypothetical protein
LCVELQLAWQSFITDELPVHIAVRAVPRFIFFRDNSHANAVCVKAPIAAVTKKAEVIIAVDSAHYTPQLVVTSFAA